jgi:predicted transcriptional regulator
MTVREIKNLLSCETLWGEELLDRKVHTACGADMMSDVLAFVKDQSVLITGLVNLQTVRTAMMMDIVCIVFVRGKVPAQDVIDLAADNDIIILSTSQLMFESCGKLFGAGLRGGKHKNES